MSTGIEWTDETWNPTTGCTKVSPGCDHCYAEVMYERFNGKGSFATVKMHSSRLAIPFHWRKPRKVFVNSMSDLFHDAIPDEYIAQVFAVMALAPQHTFQILTKRHGRMRSLLKRADFETLVREIAREMKYSDGRSNPRMNDQNYDTWPLPNVWLGVSVENQQWADIRIPALLDTPAAVRFLSCEPLLGPVDLVPPLKQWANGQAIQINQHLHWVIVGGESGHGARPMHPDWARSLRDQCTATGVPLLFKQWGAWVGHAKPGDRWFRRKPNGWVSQHTGAVLTEGEALTDSGTFQGMHRVGKKAAGRELDGRTWDQYPVTAEHALTTTDHA